MSKQNLVSLELAKLIKEWGWDGECDYAYFRLDWKILDKDFERVFLLSKDVVWTSDNKVWHHEAWYTKGCDLTRVAKAPHLIDDLCIKYKEEMFGEEEDVVCEGCRGEPSGLTECCDGSRNCPCGGRPYYPWTCPVCEGTGMEKDKTVEIFKLLQQGKKDETEEYFKSVCILNPKNKV